MEAAAMGDADLVDLLLDYGADTTKELHNGLTAEVIARSKGRNEIAGLLSASDE